MTSTRPSLCGIVIEGKLTAELASAPCTFQFCRSEWLLPSKIAHLDVIHKRRAVDGRDRAIGGDSRSEEQRGLPSAPSAPRAESSARRKREGRRDDAVARRVGSGEERPRCEDTRHCVITLRDGREVVEGRRSAVDVDGHVRVERARARSGSESVAGLVRPGPFVDTAEIPIDGQLRESGEDQEAFMDRVGRQIYGLDRAGEHDARVGAVGTRRRPEDLAVLAVHEVGHERSRRDDGGKQLTGSPQSLARATHSEDEAIAMRPVPECARRALGSARARSRCRLAAVKRRHFAHVGGLLHVGRGRHARGRSGEATETKQQTERAETQTGPDCSAGTTRGTVDMRKLLTPSSRRQ